MPRPTRCRRIAKMPVQRSFSPDDDPNAEIVKITLDEYETLRLLDCQGMTQEECAVAMNVARTTVTAIYERARRKVADAIVNGKRLLITGGCCSIAAEAPPDNLIEKGQNDMRIAIPYENGDIFQHFGHTEQFKLYDADNGRIISEQLVGTNGSGHGALAGFLTAVQADALICGGIGAGAQMALKEAGIALYAGVSGSADRAAAALAAGSLEYDPDARCDHHDHHGEGHRCGSHGCGGNSCS